MTHRLRHVAAVVGAVVWPASELETAVSFAKDPEMPTERRHPDAHSSPRPLNAIAVWRIGEWSPVSTWYLATTLFTYSSGVTATDSTNAELE